MRIQAMLIFFLSYQCTVLAFSANPLKINALYSSLDEKSVTQHLAFYQLYQNSQEGKNALKHAWRLLNNSDVAECDVIPHTPLNSVVNGIVSLVTKEPGEPLPDLSESDLAVIELLGSTLANRKLKGYYAQNEEEVLALPAEDIDLTKAVLLTQLGNEKESIKQIRIYQALLDLMALQVRAKLPPQATPIQKIRALNDFVFGEMGFRFPPHSLYAKDIDIYTFLPSVLDGRRGVCLGVSVLYICISQRIGLPLEAITPPGHIYIRYRDSSTEINIETTARGVHVDSEEYLSISTKSLQTRNIKEVIGMTHFNHASTHLTEGRYAEALTAYKKAEKYVPDDKLITELMAYQYLLLNQKDMAMSLLKQVENYTPDYAIYKETMAEDLLMEAVDAEGIKAYFLSVDDTRISILAKQKALTTVLERYPRFRMGWLSLAITWLQLHRHHEALETLEKYWELDSYDPNAAYYLTMLYVDRLDYNKAQKHFKYLQNILSASGHQPKIIKDLQRALALLNPE